MRETKIGILALVCFFFMSCEKRTKLLPAKTHEGRNTFGYRIDNELVGSAFGSYGDLFTFGDSTINITYDERHKSHVQKNDYRVLSISLSHDTETFVLTGADYRIKNNHYAREDVFTLDSGFLNFAAVAYVNYDKKVLSGLFEFTFKPSYSIHYSDTVELADSTENIHIWDGRFDLKELG